MIELNKIYNEDCLVGMKKIPDNSIDLILTDPPYIISKKSNFATGGSWNNASDKAFRKTPPKTDFGEWDKTPLDLHSIFKHFYRILTRGGTLIWFYDVWKLQEVKEIATKIGFKQLRICRWDKTNPVPVNSKINYLSNVSEYFLTMVKGGKPVFNSAYDKGIYTMPICSGNERTEHPNQKPLALIVQLVKKHSNENAIVLDSYIGSGTTAIACINTNRNYIGFELDKHYCDIANERIQRAMQDKATSEKGL